MVQPDIFQTLDNWFLSQQGKAVAQAFVEHLKGINEISTQMKGASLLQLGACGENAWLPLLNYQKKWILAPTLSVSHKIDICAAPKPLPFDQDSFDCVVAPFTFEAYRWNNHPLDEIDRVLNPMGHLVIFGVNLWSLWGLALRLGWLTYMGQPISMLRLKHALLHRGYTICHLAPFYYIPPVKRQSMIEQLEIFNELGKMVSPCPSGFYCMVLQKYVANLLKPERKRRSWQAQVSTPALQPVGYRH